MSNDSQIVPTQEQSNFGTTETTKMNLQTDITVNGVKYRRGMNVAVPKKQADDIARIDYDAQKAKNDLVRQPKEYISQMGRDVQI